VRHNVHLFSVSDADVMAVDPPCRDPRDNQFLALALAAEADVVVSSDEDLLALHPWRGIPVVMPAEFLSRFKF
jgi:predicted nucleic acid-binding protein